MPSVCIVGAGPAGLVSAKTLLQKQWQNEHGEPCKFDVTVLEKLPCAGGIWAFDKNRHHQDPQCNADMPTNLSRFSVAFSDFSWEDIPGEVCDRQTAGVEDIPIFPKAWQVGRYLNAYVKKFIPDGLIKYGCETTKALEVQKVGGQRRWKVTWRASKSGVNSSDGEQHSGQPTIQEDEFDHLIVASGFFNKAADLRFNQESSGSFQGPIVHSSKFRNIEDLVPQVHTGGGNVVVLGGANSGAEAAATLAAQISNTKYNSDSTKSYDGYKVVNIHTKPFHAIPRYFPSKPVELETGQINLRPTFVPLDLALYELKKRPEKPIQFSTGLVTPEKAAGIKGYLQSVIGGDQSELGSPALLDKREGLAPFAAITDMYPEFVRSGSIVPVLGRAVTIDANEEGPYCTVTVKVQGSDGKDSPEGSSTTIPNVVGIVYATGFIPQASLSWLPQEVLEKLQFESDSTRMPVLLSNGCALNPSCPNLGFAGFYAGPYWGVIEMQARILADRWSTTEHQQPESEAKEELAAMYDLRQAMDSRDPKAPQYWMGDYVGIMESLSRQLGITRHGNQEDPVIPARYTADYSESQAAQSTLSYLQTTLKASTESARFVAGAVFRALQGSWEQQRSLNSKLDEFPINRYEGTCTFHPRTPTDPGYDGEYLYIEEGTAYTKTGMSFSTSHRYVYRYSARTDIISVWFVKKETSARPELVVDYLFNEMKFEPQPRPGEEHKGWVATSDHLCVKDMYKSYCEFRFRGAQVERFVLTYDVKGPKKDYVSETWFTRAKPAKTDI